jgi:hypothetical protein
MDHQPLALSFRQGSRQRTLSGHLKLGLRESRDKTRYLSFTGINVVWCCGFETVPLKKWNGICVVGTATSQWESDDPDVTGTTIGLSRWHRYRRLWKSIPDSNLRRPSTYVWSSRSWCLSWARSVVQRLSPSAYVSVCFCVTLWTFDEWMGIYRSLHWPSFQRRC